MSLTAARRPLRLALLGLMLLCALGVAPTASGAGGLLVRTVRVAPPGVDPNGPSGEPSLSADGRYVAFASEASNLGPAVATARRSNVYVFDATRGDVRLVSQAVGGRVVDGPSRSPSISANGQVVAFASQATNLTPGTSGHISRIYVRIGTGPIRLLSRGFGGAALDGDCTQPVVSADGRYVAFSSTADNLVPGDDNAASDVFLVDLRSGSLQRISVNGRGGQALGASYNPSITADGRFVSFTSTAADLVRGDRNAVPDVFMHDTVTRTTFRISTSSSGREQNASIAPPFTEYSSLSGDGHYIVFDSNATNLVRGAGGHTDVFRKSVITGHVWLVSAGSTGVEADNDSFAPAQSSDARVTAFESFAENLADPWAAGTNIYAQDFGTGGALSLDVTPTGDPRGVELDPQLLQRPAVSGNGAVVAFASGADNLVAGDYNGTDDVFLRTVLAPSTTLVRAPAASTADTRPVVEVGASLPLAAQAICQLDHRRWLCPIGRPFRLPRTRRGMHVLRVFAGAPGTLFDQRGAQATFTETG